MYIEALKNSGFKDFNYQELKKIKPNNNNHNLYKDKETTDNCNIKVNCHKNRKKKSIWCKRPLFVNIGKYLFKLIDKRFNQNNILHKIFNRKTLTISYSCTNNF